jgi:hypothetical protein
MAVNHPNGVQAVGGPLKGTIISFQTDGTAASHIGYSPLDDRGERVEGNPEGFYDLVHDGMGNRLYLWREPESGSRSGT